MNHMNHSVMSEIAKQLYANSLDRLDLSLIEYAPICGPNEQRSSCVAVSDCYRFTLSLRWRDSSNEEVPYQGRLELELWGPSNFYAMEPSGDFPFPVSLQRDDWVDFYSDALYEARRLVIILLSPASLEPRIRTYLREADKLQSLLIA